jgi:hypothetical protein
VFESTLPKSLKHLLAGRVDCLGDDAVTVKSKESFSTVRMPSGIPAGDMSKLEILSHVWVSDSAKELDNLGEKLKQLRKLGVVLCGGSKANLKDLFAQINKLHTTLRSLSIRMKPVSSWGSTEAVLMTPPFAPPDERAQQPLQANPPRHSPKRGQPRCPRCAQGPALSQAPLPLLRLWRSHLQ